MCTKTRNLIGMLYRNFYNKYSSTPTLSKLYKALIRPCLEYASVIWDPDPHLVKDIVAIKNVQTLHCRSTPSSGTLVMVLYCMDALSVPLLSSRRKTRSSLVHCPIFLLVCYIFSPTTHSQKCILADKLTIPHCHSNTPLFIWPSCGMTFLQCGCHHQLGNCFSWPMVSCSTVVLMIILTRS